MERETLHVLDTLVKEEMSAVETYRQALQKVADQPGAQELARIEAEHEEAVWALRDRIAREGQAPSESSGAWGVWAKAVEGGAKVFGNKAAIKALKEGEEHGVKRYQEVLEEPGLDPEVRELISAKLLPRTRAHIPVLDRFLA